MVTARLVDLTAPQMCITADKGFNYSAQDEAFIVQKKNHFQVTCDVQFNGYVQGIPSQTGKSNLALREGRKDISDILWHFFFKKI